MYDLIIIGSGPAGVSAASLAAKQKLNFIILSENVGSYGNFISEAKSYPKLSYLVGFDIMRNLISQLKKAGVTISEGEKIISIEEINEGYIVKSTKNSYKTKTILVATGRQFRHLGIKGEKELDGKGVSFCALFDGEKFTDKTIAIIGGGHTGLFSTVYMMAYAKKIYLIEKQKDIARSRRVRSALEILDKTNIVDVLTNTETLEIIGKKSVTALKIKHNNKELLLAVDAIFVAIGYEPNTDFVSHLVKLNSLDEIIIDKDNNTSREGIFAAGDVTDVAAKQILSALGEGTKAAYSVLSYLEKNKLIEK